MNSMPKRMMALAAAAAMSVSFLAGLHPAAKAAEDTVTDSYVLKFEGEGAKPYLYGSRFSFDHSYNDPAAGENSVWSYNNCPEIFNLVGPNGSVAAYCTDADTSTKADTDYRRIDLEDSTYHEQGAAQKLRSIILNTFPLKSVEEVAAAANAAGFAVTELSQGELISATQQAIWETTHGDKYSVESHFDGIRSMYSYDESEFVYPDSLEAEETEYTASNMENLYLYFLSLEGTAPMVELVSESSLQNVTTGVQVNGSGNYDVTVTVYVEATVKSSDTLTLTAITGAFSQTQDVTEAGTYTFTFENLSAVSDITLQLSGWQLGGDVYLFDAEGERSNSQSMIGYDDTLLPVYGEITVTPDDRIINFHKTTGDTMPLENIRFSIYAVGDWEDYINGKLSIGEIPTEADIAAYVTGKTPIAVVTTDADGFASYNFGKTDGVYLVVEEPNPAITKPVDPFFVCVPGMDSTDGNPDYIIDINPKNEVITEDVIIEKDVTEIDRDEDTFDVGEYHTWIIQSSIPVGIASGLRYEIRDTLDHRLTYVGNLKLTLAKATDMAHEETVLLTQGVHYTLQTWTDVDENGNSVDAFVVSLTADGMAEAAKVLNDGYELRVYFDAYINTTDGSDVLGQEIPNQAHVDYTNNVGIAYEDDSDIPVVYTGGLNLLKVDASNNAALAGATFRIARVAKEQEQVDYYMEINGVQTGMVYVAFYAEDTLSGEKVTQVITDTEGKALFYGLAYGTYYLIETQAPEGYNRLTKPVAVVINAFSHVTDHAEGGFVTVTNSPKFELPGTGGMGNTAFYLIGIGVIAAAVCLYVFVVKKKTV